MAIQNNSASHRLLSIGGRGYDLTVQKDRSSLYKRPEPAREARAHPQVVQLLSPLSYFFSEPVIAAVTPSTIYTPPVTYLWAWRKRTFLVSNFPTTARRKRVTVDKAGIISSLSESGQRIFL